MEPFEPTEERRKAAPGGSLEEHLAFAAFESTEERRRLAAGGSLDERLAFAKKIGNNKPDSARFKQAIALTAKRYLKSRGVTEERLRELTLRAPPPAWHGVPTTGFVKVFALLIEFADHPHNIAANTINERLFGSPTTGKPYESLANYYKRASYGKLDLSGGITLGWYNTDKKRSAIETTGNSRDSLIKEALQHFEAQGHNFAQYDNDNDGVIDYFMVFWTGPNTGWGTFWWGYQTTFSDSSFKLDGKRLNKYSWQWEAQPIGSAFNPRVAIHETGHALGLPDLYDYDGNVGPDGGVGGADMMDANSLDHNCFSKWMMEWLEPTIVGLGTHTRTLNPSGTSGDCVAIWPDLDEEKMFSEFFIVQNRQPVGNDVQLSANGLMVWHVDARLDSSENNFEFDNSWAPHKFVRLMEADALEDIEANRGFNVGDLYTPGKTLGPNTVPSSRRYDGRHTYVEISNIIASGSKISAVFKCGEYNIPVTGSALTSCIAADLMHVYYLGSNNRIYELAFWEGKWYPRDVTADAGGQPAATGSPLTSCTAAGLMHVYYLGSNNHVYELAFWDRKWWPRDVTTK